LTCYGFAFRIEFSAGFFIEKSALSKLAEEFLRRGSRRNVYSLLEANPEIT
jgi:hypothetical protein